jgi:hypothetical protein
MKMNMFAIMGMAKPITETIRGLYLAAVTYTTVQVPRLPWWLELRLIGHNLLYLAWTDRGLVYSVYTYIQEKHVKHVKL